MDANDTTHHAPAAVRRGTDEETRPTHVVLVADSDAAVTDEVAGLLRDSYAVRTAYAGSDVLSSLDDVSVVLLDPTFPDLSVGEVHERVGDGGGDCRVAALVDGDRPGECFDDCVRKPVSPDALRSTVDRLCRCVAYRDTLDRYYDVAAALAELPPEDPQHDRLADRLADLESDLDEVAAAIDSSDAYEAALREHGDCD